MVASAVYPPGQQLTARFDGVGVGVIYQPDSKKFTGPLMFSAPDPKNEDVSAGQLETTSILFIEGTQFVEEDKWEKIYAHPANQDRIKALEKRRVLTIIKPEINDGEMATSTTQDFPDEEDALQLIETAYGMEWLQASFNVETARPRVRAACQSRRTVLQKLILEKKLPEQVFRV